MVQLAIGEAPPEPKKGKNPAAVALGRLGGLKGGRARAQRLSNEERSESARRAATARWRRTAWQAEEICGDDEIYARVVRAGGDRPTAKLELVDGTLDTYDVASTDIAKEIGKHLYNTVKLRVSVAWDRQTLEPKRMTVTGIDNSWEDVHLADVLQKHRGTLPITFDFESVEELVQARRDT